MYIDDQNMCGDCKYYGTFLSECKNCNSTIKLNKERIRYVHKYRTACDLFEFPSKDETKKYLVGKKHDCNECKCKGKCKK